MGVSIVMGVPQARWMVYFMENPKIKWMRTRGPPISGNLHFASVSIHDLSCVVRIKNTKISTYMIPFGEQTWFDGKSSMPRLAN